MHKCVRCTLNCRRSRCCEIWTFEGFSFSQYTSSTDLNPVLHSLRLRICQRWGRVLWMDGWTDDCYRCLLLHISGGETVFEINQSAGSGGGTASPHPLIFFWEGGVGKRDPHVNTRFKTAKSRWNIQKAPCPAWATGKDKVKRASLVMMSASALGWVYINLQFGQRRILEREEGGSLAEAGNMATAALLHLYWYTAYELQIIITL